MGTKGSKICSEGEIIMQESLCREACGVFNLPVGKIFGGSACYKDTNNYCHQNGKNNTGASMICKMYEEKGKTLANILR